MWESPVNVIMGEIELKVENDIYKAIQNVGIDVNKEELIKAMRYDRGQYEKGYKDGYADAIDEFAEALKKELRNYDFWKFDVVTQYGVQETNVPRDWIVDEIARELKGGAEC